VKKPDGRKTVKYDPMLERGVREASSSVAQLLQQAGISDTFQVKIHAFTPQHKKDVAIYRSMSQFTGNIIFWINPKFISIAKVHGALAENTVTDLIEDSLLHEYGHVIYEWAVKRDGVLLNMILHRFHTEEMFAEFMIGALREHSFISNPDDIVSQFIKSAFGE
jgi:hypothetical protein